MGTNHYIDISRRSLRKVIAAGVHRDAMPFCDFITDQDPRRRLTRLTDYYMENTGRKYHRRLRLHVGKSSYGWRFILHYIPGLCETLDDWKAIIAHADNIEDEYHKKETADDLLKVITERGIRFNNAYCSGKGSPPESFLMENRATWDAENGLVRHNCRIVSRSEDGVTYDMVNDDSQCW